MDYSALSSGPSSPGVLRLNRVSQQLRKRFCSVLAFNISPFGEIICSAQRGRAKFKQSVLQLATGWRSRSTLAS